MKIHLKSRYMDEFTAEDAKLHQGKADAPWREALREHEVKMDVMETRDGAFRIEWTHASSDGNLDAGWVIYEPGDDYPAILDSNPYPWKDMK